MRLSHIVVAVAAIAVKPSCTRELAQNVRLPFDLQLAFFVLLQPLVDGLHPRWGPWRWILCTACTVCSTWHSKNSRRQHNRCCFRFCMMISSRSCDITVQNGGGGWIHFQSKYRSTSTVDVVFLGTSTMPTAATASPPRHLPPFLPRLSELISCAPHHTLRHAIRL